MPADQRGWFDDHESRPPVEETRQEDHCKSGRVGERTGFDLMFLVEGELLAKEEVLGNECRSATGNRSKENPYVRRKAANKGNRRSGSYEQGYKHQACIIAVRLMNGSRYTIFAEDRRACPPILPSIWLNSQRLLDDLVSQRHLSNFDHTKPNLSAYYPPIRFRGVLRMPAFLCSERCAMNSPYDLPAECRSCHLQSGLCRADLKRKTLSN